MHKLNRNQKRRRAAGFQAMTPRGAHVRKPKPADPYKSLVEIEKEPAVRLMSHLGRVEPVFAKVYDKTLGRVRNQPVFRRCCTYVNLRHGDKRGERGFGGKGAERGVIGKLFSKGGSK